MRLEANRSKLSVLKSNSLVYPGPPPGSWRNKLFNKLLKCMYPGVCVRVCVYVCECVMCYSRDKIIHTSPEQRHENTLVPSVP